MSFSPLSLFCLTLYLTPLTSPRAESIICESQNLWNTSMDSISIFVWCKSVSVIPYQYNYSYKLKSMAQMDISRLSHWQYVAWLQGYMLAGELKWHINEQVSWPRVNVKSAAEARYHIITSPFTFNFYHLCKITYNSLFNMFNLINKSRWNDFSLAT